MEIKKKILVQVDDIDKKVKKIFISSRANLVMPKFRCFI